MNNDKNLLIVLGEFWETRRNRLSPTINRNYWWLPTPGNVIFTLLVMGSLLWAQSAGAITLAAPPVNSSLTIPYQGRLANASGSPFTGNQNMEFRLYNTPSGGTPLWIEFWTGGNAVNVSDGLFSVLLGSLQSGLPSAVQSNSQLWLGITVGTDGEMSPRVQLGSAAYSMQALSVPDGSITSAKLAEGSVTVADLADSSINSAKVQDQTIGTNDLADGSVTPAKSKPQTGSICLNNNVDIASAGNWQAVNIPGLNLPFVLEKSSKVLIWIDGLALSNLPIKGEVDVQLGVDDTAHTASFGGINESWFNVKGQRIINLGPGNHTLQSSVLSGAAGTVTVHGVGIHQTCINYLVVGVQ